MEPPPCHPERSEGGFWHDGIMEGWASHDDMTNCINFKHDFVISSPTIPIFQPSSIPCWSLEPCLFLCYEPCVLILHWTGPYDTTSPAWLELNTGT